MAINKIPLSQGKFTIIDKEDFEWLNQWKWYCNSYGYAVREKNYGVKNGKRVRKSIWMHREINKTPKGMDTDHIDRNPLNNKKSNLRTVTHGQNMFNLSKAKNNISGYKGVSWHKETQKWRAYLQINKKQKYFGLFSDIKDAILARKRGELIYHAI